MNWWLNETYNIDDVIQNIRKPGPWRDTNATTINRTGYYDDLNLDIKTVESPYGRCYSLYFHNSLSSEDQFYGITINTTQVPEMTFYIHEKFNEVGLLWSYWPIDPETITVKEKDQFIVEIQKNTYTPRDSNSIISCKSEDNYSYPDCVTRWIRRKYLETFVQNNKTGE